MTRCDILTTDRILYGILELGAEPIRAARGPGALGVDDVQVSSRGGSASGQPTDRAFLEVGRVCREGRVASRQALDALVDLAIEEECRFVLLAGDVSDGEVKNFSAALHFMGAMRRLDEKGIKVFVVLGNHDSANRFATKKLEFAGNVHVFGKARAKSVNVDGLDVVVHGRSFPSPEFNENMALDYPVPVLGKFNIVSGGERARLDGACSV
jgi:hypothetical protein